MRCLSSEATAIATVQQALALGINHLETAQGYGNSEIYLGNALKSLAVPRAQVYLTTKLSPTASADGMARAIDTSLTRLGVDYVDCLAIHGLNTWDHLRWVESAQGGMQAVRQAVADGKIRHVGFSTHAALEVILAAIATGEFEFVNLHYYYFFQRHAPAIERAAQQDLGVFIISPADKGGMLHTPPARLEEQCQPFSPLEFNYRFLLSDRRITTLSVGPAHAGELQSLHPLLEMDSREVEMQAVIARLQAQAQLALGDSLCSQCYACLPCPEEIQIPEVLRLRNLAIAYDMTDFGKYRYRMFENAGHWFPGSQANRCTDCNECLPRCPAGLSIPALLRETHEQLHDSTRSGQRLWRDL